MLPRETAGVAGVGALGTEEDLGGDDDIATVLRRSVTSLMRLALVPDQNDP